MGSVRFGIPRELALALKAKHGTDYFVETGTSAGDTTRWAAVNFKKVDTVDNQPGILGWGNVTSYRGDSAEFLEQHPMASSALFWLDAHTNESCPVLREIAAINKSPLRHVILVDDVRLFGQMPAWPTLGTVIKELVDGGRRSIYVEDDVIVAEPCP